MYGNYYPTYAPQNYYNPSGAMPDTLSQYKGQYQQPMQQMTIQQPPQQPIPPMSQPTNDLIWVLGEVEATSYPVAPGNTVVLWDRDNDTLYIKSANAQGVPSMRILDYTERASVPQKKASEHKCQCAGQFVSMDVFRDLEARFTALEGEVKTKTRKTAKEDDNNG